MDVDCVGKKPTRTSLSAFYMHFLAQCTLKGGRVESFDGEFLFKMIQIAARHAMLENYRWH